MDTPTVQTNDNIPQAQVEPASIAVPESNPIPSTTETTPAITEISTTILGASDATGKDATTQTADKAGEDTKVQPASTEITDTKTKDAATDNQKDIQEKTESKPEQQATTPTYDDFTFPDGTSISKENIEGFTKLLGEFETTSKANHTEVQKLGQALLERHVTELNKATEQLTAKLKEDSEAAHKIQIQEWEKAFKADPDIGGNRQDTTISAANEFIATHAGNAEQQKEFRAILEKSGLGSHPVMIRVLAKAMDSSSNLREGSPIPATMPAGVKDKIHKRYGT